MSRIGVAKLGGPAWERYALYDEHSRYWTGTNWSGERHTAMLFAGEQAAAAEYERVVALVRAGQPMREYTARVAVRVVGHEQYDHDRLKRYLSAGCRLYLGPDPLEGPAPDAEVTVEIAWDGLADRGPSGDRGA